MMEHQEQTNGGRKVSAEHQTNEGSSRNRPWRQEGSSRNQPRVAAEQQTNDGRRVGVCACMCVFVW